MADDLSGALARVARAEEHLGTLDESIEGWLQQKAASLSGDKNPERTEYRFHVDFDPMPDVIRWALLIGDCVHNLRSALDHAVYASSGPTPPGGCEFPVFLHRRYFDLPENDRRGHLYKIRGVKNDVVRALIERTQPWKNEERPEDHPLWVIHQLDIQDKHRLLTPVASVPRAMDVDVHIEYFQAGTHPPSALSAPEWVPFEDHAEVLTLETGEPAKRVEMKGAFQFGISIPINDKGWPVIRTLREACRYTRGMVEQIGDALV